MHEMINSKVKIKKARLKNAKECQRSKWKNRTGKNPQFRADFLPFNFDFSLT